MKEKKVEVIKGDEIENVTTGWNADEGAILHFHDRDVQLDSRVMQKVALALRDAVLRDHGPEAAAVLDGLASIGAAHLNHLRAVKKTLH